MPTTTRNPYKKSIRELVYQVHYGKTVLWGTETYMAAITAGLLEYDTQCGYLVTEEGKRVAAEFKSELEARRAKTNANARARSAAMSSLGMKRTRYGWE